MFNPAVGLTHADGKTSLDLRFVPVSCVAEVVGT